jgi:hypothetical protein
VSPDWHVGEKSHACFTISSVAGLIFDRVVSQALLTELGEHGRFHGLLERRTSRPEIADVQLRREQRGDRSWASLYLGLTSVLDLDEHHGLFRLRAHPTHKAAGQFDEAWGQWQEPDRLGERWSQVDAYLGRLLEDQGIAARLWHREGTVQTALTSGYSPAFGVVQREAVVSFPTEQARHAMVEPIQQRIWGAVTSSGRFDPWWPGIRDGGKQPELGDEADLVSTDSSGRLLVIEAKPFDELKGITWAPAQVRLYAELFAALIEDNPATSDVLNEMVAQRASLGLMDGAWTFAPTWELRVAPVIAIGGWPASPVALTRLAALVVALQATAALSDRIDPLEVWLLDEHGHPETIWRPDTESVPDLPVDRRRLARIEAGGSFVHEARRCALDWKLHTESLIDAARVDGTYGRSGALPICLPAELAELNLLPDARDAGLSRFEAGAIKWHNGIGEGPTNHLLDSQIQCVNALAPFVERPDCLRQLFGSVLPIAQVIPFGASTSAFDRVDHVVFEWVGLANHLGEWSEPTPTRGAYMTSVDAALRYRTHDGRTEVALIEWKYTERYPSGALSGGEARMEVRHNRYGGALRDPLGPIRRDAVPFEALFFEPMYQQMRQQLLAWRMEEAHELDTDVVRVVLVAPRGNEAFWSSLPGAKWRELAGPSPLGVAEAFRSVLRCPDRFAWLDSATLVEDDSPLSDEFKHRYRHLGLGAPVSLPRSPSGDEVTTALDHALTVLSMLSGEGSVLCQLRVLDPDAVGSLTPKTRAEVLAGATELTELARRLGTGPLHNALSELGLDPDGHA